MPTWKLPLECSLITLSKSGIKLKGASNGVYHCLTWKGMQADKFYYIDEYLKDYTKLKKTGTKDHYCVLPFIWNVEKRQICKNRK
jgi:hypothetical protein